MLPHSLSVTGVIEDGVMGQILVLGLVPQLMSKPTKIGSNTIGRLCALGSVCGPMGANYMWSLPSQFPNVQNMVIHFDYYSFPYIECGATYVGPEFGRIGPS